MMICKFCQKKAIIRLPYARLSLCQVHFNEFMVKKVLKSIKRYKMISKGDRILVAVSGGKDSTTLLHILSLLSSTLNIELYGIYIDLGLGEYSEKSKQKVKELFKLLNIEHVIVDLKESLGFKVPELSKLSKRPTCSVCGLIKRYVLNTIALNLKANSIATGHTMDDMIAYILKEFILGNYGQLVKLKPKLEAIAGLMPARIKPLVEVSERESLVYALVNNLPIYHGECPYRPQESIEVEIKSFFNMLETRHPGIKIQFLRKFFKGEAVNLKDVTLGEIKKCSICGMPSSTDVCALCKLIYRIEGSYNRILEFLDKINSIELLR